MWVSVCLDTWIEIPNISVLLEWVLSTAGHLPVTIFLNLEKNKKGRDILKLLHITAVIFLEIQTALKGMYHFQRQLSLNRFFWVLHISMSSYSTMSNKDKNLHLHPQGPYGRCLSKAFGISDVKCWRKKKIVLLDEGKAEIRCAVRMS